MYIEDLALNNPQWLICHKNKSNKTHPVWHNPESCCQTSSLPVATLSIQNSITVSKALDVGLSVDIDAMITANTMIWTGHLLFMTIATSWDRAS